jgi:hypothetical protein
VTVHPEPHGATAGGSRTTIIERTASQR